MGVIKSKKLYKTFTLIEVIVVIATIGLVLPVIFAIVFFILQQQVKIQRLSIVKREGDYALNIIENIIRNYAESIHSNIPPNDNNKICQLSNNNNLYDASYFKDKFGNWFRFYLDTNNLISSVSSILNNGSQGLVNLNSYQTKISNFSIQCYRTALYSPPVINISFTIEHNTNSSRVEEKITPLTYQTKIKLKSY